MDLALVYSFLEQYGVMYVWFTITTFLNMVTPVSGSVVNPVTALFVDLPRAIGIGALVFAFSATHRVFLFRERILSDAKHIHMLKWLIPFSICGAIAGATLVARLNVQVLAVIIIISSGSFIYKTLRQISREDLTYATHTTWGLVATALGSGFFQAGGLSGAGIRNNYLRTLLPEASVRALSSSVGLFVFSISGAVIFLHNKLFVSDLVFVALLLPLLMVAQAYGKTFLEKMEDRKAKLLSVAFSIIGITLLANKYLF
jgi:uncharacterized membrane protein YfcA